MTGITVDGLNTIVPMMAAFHGWNQDVLLSISTPASIIALFACVLWAAFIEKAGLKKTTIITMVLAGISMIAYGNAVNIAMYAVALVCIVTFINAFACNCGFAICANWFPTKKGIVMGITTIGMNLASALINWILTGLANSFQISSALSILGIAIIVLAVLLGLLVKGTPEEAGCYPDNDPEIAAIIKAEEEGVKEMEKVSYAGALKNKYVWIFGLGAGCFGLATVGIMSQLVGYFMAARGYELTGALSMLTIAAVIGMIGSWAWGIVDQKLGTQKACLLFGIWYFVGIAFLIAPPTPCMYIGLFMLGGAIGGNGNFLPSLAAQAFGRKDFNVSYACMNMINGIIRSCSFFVLAVLRSMTSGYTVPYMVFAVIAVIGGILIVAVKEKKAIQ
ncbi:MFS transporter [Coprococcus catus]|uniref:MFS transporter n=1 Tax=Coprococcus catus TaxID=116085 RepID=UPI00207A9FCB